MKSVKSNVVTINFSMHWLFMPPAVAVFTIILTGFFPSGSVITVNPAIWGLAGLMFVLLTVLYGIFIKQYFFGGLFPVQLMAQGILLCPLSLRMGVLMLSWVGVLLTICGAVILVALYYRSRANRTLPQAEPKSELAALPLPFAITDAKGCIISASDSILRLMQKARSSVNEENIRALLPLDKETVGMGGKEWRILQAPMKDGTHYFQLEEVRDVTVTLSANAGNNNSFIDSATSLYTQSYAIRRVEQELYRIYRYKRWMSAALLRVNFLESEASYGSSSEKENELFNSYCRFISSKTRETDISCLVGPCDILIVMPETQLDGAQDVVSKLLDFTANLKEEAQGFGGAMEIHERTVFFNASSGVLDFDRLMEKLDEQ